MNVVNVNVEVVNVDADVNVVNEVEVTVRAMGLPPS